MALRDQILAADDRQTEKIDVPEWGCAVYVQVLDGFGRAQFEALCEGKKPADGRIMERLLVCTLVDENGQRLFEGTEEDVLALSKKNAAPLFRLFKVASRLNAIGADAVEDLKKNS